MKSTLENLERVYLSNKDVFNSTFLKKEHSKLNSAIYVHFKSLKDALDALNIEFKVQRQFHWCIDSVREYVVKNSGCSLISDKFKTVNDNLVFLCKCGEGFETSFDKFKNRSKKQCNECSGETASKRMSLSYKEVKKFIEKESGSMCVLLSQQYKNAYDKLTLMCECGEKFNVSFRHFKFSDVRQCHSCSGSKGERLVSQYLRKSNVKFTSQKTYDDLIYEDKLKLDFYLGDYSILIEYDGEHHFYPIDFANRGKKWAEEQFNIQKDKDKTKNQYCIDNNIPLIRIPYWEFDNIEYILNNVLKYFNIIEGGCEDAPIVEKYYVRDGWCHDTYIS